MPRSTPEVRSQKAHERALATVAALATTPDTSNEIEDETGEDNPLPEETPTPTAVAETTPALAPETEPRPTRHRRTKAEMEALKSGGLQEVQEVMQEVPPPPKVPPKQADTRRQPGEDFLEYQARISPNDWSSGLVYGNYVYKILPQGRKKRIGDEPIKRPLTMADMKEIVADNGPGSYLVQFQTSLKYLTPCHETFSFDDEGRATLGSAGFNRSDPEGLGYTMKIASDITKDAAKAAVDMVKENQTQHNRQPDLGALLSGMASVIAAVQPKPQEDKTAELIMTMLQNQAREAERRAEASEQRAQEQRRLDREDAERRERLAKEEAAAARERDNQFFQLMLKQAETKADSLNQMTGLLSNFIKVKNEIDDSLGGGPKGPWDLVGQVADGVLQQGPAIVAALRGAPPAQVAQMQNPQPPQQDAQPFYEMVIRLAKYFQRDPANYDGPYLVGMIETEYGPVFSEIINQPKDDVLRAIAGFEPFGKAIMDHPQASQFMARIVDAIKFPDTIDDIFPDEEEPPQAENPPMLHGRARKVNGKGKEAV